MRSALRRFLLSSPARGLRRVAVGVVAVGVLRLIARVAAGLDVVERLLERLHQVRRGRRLLLRLWRLDRPALALVLDHTAQPLAIAVLVALRIPLRRQRLDERDGLVELLLRRLLLPAGGDGLRRADLVVEE